MKPSTRLRIHHALKSHLQRIGLDVRRYPPPDLPWPEHVLDGILASRSPQPPRLPDPLTDEHVEAFLLYCLHHRAESTAQLFQDLFVRWVLEDKTDGFFVEFGATNGFDLSNTFFLEAQRGWQGILAEPARSWHSALKSNRSCVIDTRCVWSATGDPVPFREVGDPTLSTLAPFSEGDSHAARRLNHTTYQVPTVSLNDLLTEHQAPHTIDYLSLDTEGTELDILSTFDFQCHQISIITVEHNYTGLRDKMYDLLTQQGFVRCFASLSKWDDWYVNANTPGPLQTLLTR